MISLCAFVCYQDYATPPPSKKLLNRFSGEKKNHWKGGAAIEDLRAGTKYDQDRYFWEIQSKQNSKFEDLRARTKS